MTNCKEILILTDNIFLAQRFEKLVWPKVDSTLYKLSFGCSPCSEIDKFDLFFPITSINLKKTEHIETLLKKDLIISLHCKQLFPLKLLNNVRCINIHPGYNPTTRGWFPHVFAIINDLEIGVTIHEIDEKLDHGKIIIREKVDKYNHDTSLTLYNRIIEKEIELLTLHINSIIENSYTLIQPECGGNIFLEKDFINLCKLNLEKK